LGRIAAAAAISDESTRPIGFAAQALLDAAAALEGAAVSLGGKSIVQSAVDALTPSDTKAGGRVRSTWEAIKRNAGTAAGWTAAGAVAAGKFVYNNPWKVAKGTGALGVGGAAVGMLMHPDKEARDKLENAEKLNQARRDLAMTSNMLMLLERDRDTASESNRAIRQRALEDEISKRDALKAEIVRLTAATPPVIEPKIKLPPKSTWQKPIKQAIEQAAEQPVIPIEPIPKYDPAIQRAIDAETARVRKKLEAEARKPPPFVPLPRERPLGAPPAVPLPKEPDKKVEAVVPAFSAFTEALNKMQTTEPSWLATYKETATVTPSWVTMYKDALAVAGSTVTDGASAIVTAGSTFATTFSTAATTLANAGTVAADAMQGRAAGIGATIGDAALARIQTATVNVNVNTNEGKKDTGATPP